MDEELSNHPASLAGSAGAFPDLGALFGGGAGAPNPLAGLMEMVSTTQRNLTNVSAEGVAGGGAVRVTLDGARRLTAVTIATAVFESGDAEMLQDLILAAANDAFEQIGAQNAETLSGIAGLFGGSAADEP